MDPEVKIIYFECKGRKKTQVTKERWEKGWLDWWNRMEKQDKDADNK